MEPKFRAVSVSDRFTIALRTPLACFFWNGKLFTPSSPLLPHAFLVPSSQVTKALKEGKSLKDIPVMPSKVDNSLVKCPHCGRTFNEAAAERHIPKCNANKPGGRAPLKKAGGRTPSKTGVSRAAPRSRR